MFATIELLGGLDMKKCFNCMNDLSASEEKCPACGTVYDNTPKAEYHLPPETILADRYILGYAIKETEVFIAYVAWDKEENKKVIKSGRYTIGDKWWFYNGNFYYDNDIVGAFSYNE